MRKLRAAKRQDFGVPVGLGCAEFDLADSSHGLCEHGRLFVARVHQGLLSSGILIHGIVIDRGEQDGNAATSKHGLPSHQLCQEQDTQQQVESAI